MDAPEAAGSLRGKIGPSPPSRWVVLGRRPFPRPRRQRRPGPPPPRKLASAVLTTVFAGQTDLGAAWKKISKDNNGRLSVKLGAIRFGERINAALVVIDGVHSLVWSRSAPKAL